MFIAIRRNGRGTNTYIILDVLSSNKRPFLVLGICRNELHLKSAVVEGSADHNSFKSLVN